MIACVQLDHFAAAVERQADPALYGVPLVLLKYSAKRGKVAAISHEAEAAGVEPGMSPSRAQALCPEAHTVTFSAERSMTAIDSLLETLWMFTNRIEVDDTALPQSAVFYLDLGRLTDGESRYMGERIMDVVNKAGWSATVGVATGKFTAQVAALVARSQQGRVQVVSREESAAFVAPYPVDLLPLSKEAARKLHVLYIRRLGELAVFTRASLISQFGKQGGLMHQLAHGQDYRPVKPRKMPKTESAARQCDAALTDRQQVDAMICDLAQELEQRLEARSSALHEMVLTLHFEDGKSRTERLHLLQPVVSAKAMMQIANQLIDRKPVSRGVLGIEICLAHLVPSIPHQLELFTHRPGKQQLIDLVQILIARHGSEGFYHAELAERDSLLPEKRFRLVRMDVS